MTDFINYLKADFYKIKRQPLLFAHILLPVLGAIIFLLYYSLAPWPAKSDVESYVKIIAVASPVVIAVVCSMAVDMEQLAGNCREMLISPVKLRPFMSKIVMLLILGFVAFVIASGVFGGGFIYILHKTPFGFGFYFKSACVLYAGSIFLYIFHIVLSFRYGKNLSVGVGIVEALLATLLRTDLGAGKWIFIPCGWGIRFISGFIQHKTDAGAFLKSAPEIHTGIISCIVLTFFMLLFACMWFKMWEGKKAED